MEALEFCSMYDPVAKHTWGFIYFDREAERLVDREWNEKHPDRWGAPDLIGCNVARDSVPDGKHEGTLYGQPATLFIWSDAELADFIVAKEDADTAHPIGDDAIYTRKGVMRRGLVVLTSDKDAYAFIEKKFNEKAKWL